MLLNNFLKQVLPQEGIKCWTSITKDKVARNHFCHSIEDLAAQILASDASGVDTYFACASYTTDRNRRAANVAYLKSFFIDVDAGEGKPYATADEAIQACDAFALRLAIPIPGIIRSGGGVHAYWPLDRTLSREEWLPLAQRLKLLAHTHGFHCDPSRTADAASILRPPGTKNYKLASPRDVEVDDESCFEPLPCAEFIDVLIKNQDVASAKSIKNTSTVNSSLLAGMSRGFDASIGTAAGARGITQLRYAGELVAKGHPYDEVLTKCLEWNQLCTPPQDEKEVERIIKSAFTMHAQKHPLPSPAPTPVGIDTVDIFSLPILPEGFRWGNAGELQGKAEELKLDGTKDVTWRTISQRPVYLMAWMNEEGCAQKNSYLFSQWHTGKGWQQFTMGAKDINGQQWYGAWVENGGSLMDGADKQFKSYIRRAENMLRLPGKELTKYSQFGWKDNDESFLVGDTLCHADGRAEKAFGTEKLAPLMQVMRPARGGSTAAWTTAANKLFTPGMEAHAFMLLASFAAPLMKFCVDEGNGGSILSIISEDSGQGKTPMATAIASVWGEMAATIVTGNFTENRRIEDLVRHCHLPQVQEEMSYGDPLVAAQGIEKFTSGSDRGRLDRGGAAGGIPERYQTIVISISNKSLYELVKMVNVPMSRRVFEIEIERPAEADMANIGGVVKEMLRNAGHPGLQYARLLVNPGVRKFIEENLRGSNLGSVGITQLKYRELLNSQPEHRFIVWPLAAIDIAARLLTRYGILNFDVERIMKWGVMQAADRISAVPRGSDAALKLNKFLVEHVDNCLAVAGPYNPAKGPQLPLRLPRGNMCMRLEINPAKLYITSDAMQKWCIKNNISFISLGKKLAESKVIMERSKMVTLAAGTEIAAGRALCWEIDMDHPEISGQLRIELRQASKDALDTSII